MKIPLSLILPLLLTAAPLLRADDFASRWEQTPDRVWIGPEYWANPLQDWRVADGRLECAVSGGDRNVFLLTHEALKEKGNLKVSVRLGRVPPFSKGAPDSGWGGFRIGIKGTLPDYRNAAIHGSGLNAGITSDGFLFVGNEKATKNPLPANSPVDLVLEAKPSDDGNYRVTLEGRSLDPARKAALSTEIAADQLTGYFALVSHFQPAANPGGKKRAAGRFTNRGGDVRFWFSQWKLSGNKIKHHGSRAFGPILWTQYTLSNGILKLTAQMAPIGEGQPQILRLEIKAGDTWKTIAEATMDPLSRTAAFRVADWNAAKDTPYRVVYSPGEGARDAHWPGTVRMDPLDKPSIVVAGFTGNTDYLFPNARLVRNVGIQNPDVLFFSGDQIYENVAGYGVQREPLETAALDYLRKWYLLGWAFGGLMRDRPSITIPDDHDVYQGNIWGHNGRLAKVPGFADGGFHMDPNWVNMVNRTQTSHLPDPYDPTPLLRGISVYYTSIDYGRVSFAVIEDRKFKSGPEAILPPVTGRADHITPEDAKNGWDPSSVDIPEARLLGERQLKFIRDWTADWRGIDFKVALSQTIFANLANYHGAEQMYLVADLDSNGWPQAGRNRALEELRRGFAFMFAGDQHLASIVHHGINAYNDAGMSFCVPSIAAGYPRAWRPEKPWPGHEKGAPDYTGRFKDGLGNRVTVHAVGNPAPEIRSQPPEHTGHDKASGHGLIRFNKKDRSITMECYRLIFDASNPKPGDQFPGWPRTIALEDNYGREAIAYLPTLKMNGLTNPVVQIVDESFGDIVYTLRIKGDTFRPKVFDSNATYTVIVGEGGGGATRTLRGINPAADESAVLEISF